MNLLLYLAVMLYAMYHYVKYKLRRRRLENMVEKFDGPPGIPILGNALEFMKSPAGALKTYAEMFATYDRPFKFWIANIPLITVVTPEDFEIVAHKVLEKCFTYKFLAEMMGDGLLTSEVTKWKRHRRIITAALNPLVYFNHFLQIFNKQDKSLMKQLHKEVGTGKHFDLWPYAMQHSLIRFCETTLGYEDDKEGGREALDYGYAVMKSSELVGKRFYQFWLMPSFNFRIYKYLRGYGNIFKMVQRLPMKVLKKYKAERYQWKSKNHNDIRDGKDLRNVIDVLLNKDCFTDEDLCAEINTLIFGGSETSSVGLCFTMLMLGIEQHVQDKVYREIFDVFGDSDRLPEQEDLNRLPYLEQCIKETMRRFSVTPLSLRYAHEDITLTNGEVIPAGANVALFIFGMNNNANIYPNPYSWDPSNFDPDKVAIRHKCSFVGFSAGPRGCIGEKFALLSLKAQISTLLRNFKVTTDVKFDDIELTVDILIKSVHGYNIKLDYRYEHESIF